MYSDKEGHLRHTVVGEYATLDNFLQAWNKADKKQVLLDEMEKHGILYKEIIKQKGIKDMDPFDLMRRCPSMDVDAPSR